MAGSRGRRARGETSETGRDRERGANGEVLIETDKGTFADIANNAE